MIYENKVNFFVEVCNAILSQNFYFAIFWNELTIEK